MDIEKLIERLYKHNKDWGERRTIDFFEVFLDCKEFATAITDLLARAEAAEARAEKAESIASDLCDDFTDFVTGGVPNVAPYCANCRPECVDGRGWCNGNNWVCKGFLPKAAAYKEE